MKRGYSTEPNTRPYDNGSIAAMQSLSLAMIKSISDSTTVQFDITIKTEGVRVTLIKKEKDNSLRKRTVECDNAELGMLPMKINNALSEVTTGLAHL